MYHNLHRKQYLFMKNFRMPLRFYSWCSTRGAHGNLAQICVAGGCLTLRGRGIVSSASVGNKAEQEKYLTSLGRGHCFVRVGCNVLSKRNISHSGAGTLFYPHLTMISRHQQYSTTKMNNIPHPRQSSKKNKRSHKK